MKLKVRMLTSDRIEETCFKDNALVFACHTKLFITPGPNYSINVGSLKC